MQIGLLHATAEWARNVNARLWTKAKSLCPPGPQRFAKYEELLRQFEDSSAGTRLRQAREEHNVS